ncbi:MAG: hypothetical protein ACOYMB_04430 [Patescibacteria group bacterium]
MEKLIFIFCIVIILLLASISLLLRKIVNKLYAKEFAAEKERKEKARWRKLQDKESEQKLRNWYRMSFLKTITFRTNFIPGFNLNRPAIEEE